jgi:hypothetical protein
LDVLAPDGRLASYVGLALALDRRSALPIGRLCFVGDRRSLSVACAFGRRSAIAGRFPTQEVGLLRWPALPFQKVACLLKGPIGRLPTEKLGRRSGLPIGRLSFKAIGKRSLAYSKARPPTLAGLPFQRSLAYSKARPPTLAGAPFSKGRLPTQKALSVACRRTYRSLAYS